MINENELYEKFSRIEDLPISEEMLGAYLEGNVAPDELSEIEFMIESQPAVSDILNEVFETPLIDDIYASSLGVDSLSPEVAGTEGYENMSGQDPFSLSESELDILDNNDLQELLSQLELPSIDIDSCNGFNSTDNNGGYDINDPINLNF